MTLATVLTVVTVKTVETVVTVVTVGIVVTVVTAVTEQLSSSSHIFFNKKKKLFSQLFGLTTKKSTIFLWQQIELWQNSKTQIVTRPINSICDNSKTQIGKKTLKLQLWKILKLWQNSKTQIGDKKLKNWNFDKNPNCDKT